MIRRPPSPPVAAPALARLPRTAVRLALAWAAPAWAALASAALPAHAGASGDPPGLPRFVEATDASGLRFVHHDAPPLPGMLPQEQSRFGSGPAVGDYDRDGDLDVYFVDSLGHANRLYRNRGDGTFEDVTEAAGVGDTGFGHMALFLDLDGDGHDDLVVFNDAVDGTASTTASRPAVVYRNRGDGTFEDVTARTGLEPWVRVLGGATAGDPDRDGDLDLYVTSWFDLRSYFFRNEGGLRFVDATEEAGFYVPDTAVAHWTPVFADFDGDGRQDVYSAVDFSEDYFFWNRGNGRFRAIQDDYHVYNDMGVAVADVDDDGDLDLYTTNVTGPGEGGPCCNWLWINRGRRGGFAGDAEEFGVSDTGWGWGTVFLDADLDGKLDLAAVNGWIQPEWNGVPSLFLRRDDGSFDERGAECGLDRPGSSRSLVAFDADRDGDLDLLVGDAFGPATFWRNDLDHGDRHSLTVRLEGRASNRNGVGARIELETADGRRRTTEMIAGGSFYAGPPLEAHFGLGGEDRVPVLCVRWPSGRTSVLRDVAADRVLTVVEPELR